MSCRPFTIGLISLHLAIFLRKKGKLFPLVLPYLFISCHTSVSGLLANKHTLPPYIVLLNIR